MQRKYIVILYALIFFLVGLQPLEALKRKSQVFRSEQEADDYLVMHYNWGSQYYNCGEWKRASEEFENVIRYFPSSEEAAEASYYLGVCYFEMKEYDFANAEFSSYLKTSNHPVFFEDAVYYKFCIAESFKAGMKKRPFRVRYLPKWISARDLALTTYDEVAAALPNHELAVRALYSKGELLKTMGEYRCSIETFQTIIRRFPKHEIVPACYLDIADAYYQQSRYEFQNPDLLALAELNVRKFNDDFPRDERVAIAEERVCWIKETYAKGLCDLGLFYERIKQPAAAAIYYQSAIEEFPDTHAAQFCYSRLICLGYEQDVVEEPIEEPVEEPIEAPIEAPVEELMEEPIEVLREAPVEEPVEEPMEVEAPVEELMEEPIEVSRESPVEEPLEEPIEVEAPVEELMEEPIEVSRESPVEEPIEEPIEAPIEVPIEEPMGELSPIDMEEEHVIPTWIEEQEELVELNSGFPIEREDDMPLMEASDVPLEVSTMPEGEVYLYDEQEVPAEVAEKAIAEGVPLYIDIEPEEECSNKEEPYYLIHYSLLKKREMRYVPSRHSPH